MEIPFQIRITGTGIEHSPNALDFGVVEGIPPSTQTLTITSLEASELTWSASTSATWIQLGATTGTTPSELAITVDPALLPPGEQSESTVAITTPDGTQFVTVAATFFDSTLDQLIADPNRPRVYGIRRGDGQPGSGILFAFDATDGNLLASLSIGPQITAATIHPADDVLYLATANSTTLQRADLATFTKLAPLDLAISNIAQLAAGPAGQIYAEAIKGSLRLLDSSSGTSISNQQTGNTALSATSASSASPPVYFRAFESPELIRITRHRLDSDTFQSLSSPPSPASTTPLLVSAKGTRIFWGGHVFNQNLRFLGDLGTPVFATSPGGELAVTGTALRRLSTGGANILTLSFPTELSAISGAAEHLFLYDNFSQSATTIPLRHFTTAPATLDLGPVPLGSDATAEATITNHGVETLTISGFQSTSDAHAVSTPLPLDIPARSSAAIALTYSPTALGTAPAEITLHTTFIEAPPLRLSATGTGTPGTLPGYAAWQIDHFGATDAPDAGPLDDPNRNAWPNFAEFLFDLDPRAHDAPRDNLPSLSNAPDGTPLLTFTRVTAAAFHLTIEHSTNIAEWSPATAGSDFQIDAITDLGDGTERVVLRLPPPTDGTAFYRISASMSAAP